MMKPTTSTRLPGSPPAGGRSARPLYMGPRIKRLRRELGLTQQSMATDLEISPSYVALIERNQRPVTADLLLRLARTYQLDITELAADDGADYNRRLNETLRDPIFAGIDLPALEVADLATSFPGVSEALLRLYGAYTREQAALADRQADQGRDRPPARTPWPRRGAFWPPIAIISPPWRHAPKPWPPPSGARGMRRNGWRGRMAFARVTCPPM
jgi:transcriptional regulator with XRE-family HTH domain